MSKYDTYTQGAGGNDPMEQSGRADPSHVEDAANRKRIQNRIAQKAYRQRLKSKMEVLESFRDTVTAAKLSELTATSPEIDFENSQQKTVPGSGGLPQVITQLLVPSFTVSTPGETLEGNKQLSYFDSPTAITRYGFHTPPIEGQAISNSDQDPLPLSSWDLGETYPMVLCQDPTRTFTSQSPGSKTLGAQSTLTPPDTTSDGKTALHVAAESGRLSTVQILLRLQSNVLAQDFAGRTGLHLAVGSQQQDIVEELLNHPACLNIQDRNGQTALHIAAAHGYESIVTILLGAGAMLELKDARGQTPLHVAAANGQDEVLQLLFIRGANINATM